MFPSSRPSSGLICVLLLAFASVAGCSREPAATSGAPASTPATAASPAAGSPDVAPASTQAPPADVRVITGEVTETMDAATYTYVKVKTAQEEVWAASSRFKVGIGDRVVVPLETPMENFHSASLNRDFPIIYFASQIRHEGKPASAPPAPGMQLPMSSHGTPTAQATAVTERIDPPQGGLSIAKIWETRKSLAGQQVTVRGKVVKVNNGIMGRNWLHLQDGSGRAEDKTNDLTITSASTASLGDVITVTGTVTIDKDFTAGYVYPVMLENATIQK